MKIYDNVLSEELMSDLHEELEILRKLPVWVSSHLAWPDNIQGFAGNVTQTLLSKNLTDRVSAELYEKYFSMYEEVQLIEYHYYNWDRLSGIPIHSDATTGMDKYFGATLYLNDWDPNAGGLFVWGFTDKFSWDDDRGKTLKAICPKKNMLIMNDENEQHMVTAISPYIFEQRVTIQIWGLTTPTSWWDDKHPNLSTGPLVSWQLKPWEGKS